jgi:hypothetical protein
MNIRFFFQLGVKAQIVFTDLPVQTCPFQLEMDTYLKKRNISSAHSVYIKFNSSICDSTLLERLRDMMLFVKKF